MKRIFSLTVAGIISASLVSSPSLAEDTEKNTEVKTEEKTKVKTEEKVKVSSAFLNRWKKIQKVAKNRAHETQQTRTVAGVRGAEAEDAVLDQLYYKGGVRYPSRVDLKNAITQLQESIKAAPEADTVAEQMFFIAQCHAQLGETANAKDTYTDIVENHSDSDFAAAAKEELKNFE